MIPSPSPAPRASAARLARAVVALAAVSGIVIPAAATLAVATPSAAAATLAPVGPAAAVASPAPASSGTTIYLDKEEALAYVFEDATEARELRHILTSAQIADIEDHIRRRLDEGGFFLYAGLRDDEITSFAAIVSEIGKVQPITHIVEVTPDGEIGRIAVMIYRETHGAEVRDERFMEQYEGKSLDDAIRIEKDIINISGATLSAQAICRGARKALAVVQTVVLEERAAMRAAMFAQGEAIPLQTNGDDLDDSLGALTAPPADLDAAASRSSVASALRASLAPADDASRADTEPVTVRAERTVMGTVCSVEVHGHDEQTLRDAVEAALDEVERWDAVLSDWRDDTPLAALNAAPVGTPQPVDADLLAWLGDAARWVSATQGAFDPTVGALVDAWGLRRRAPARPTDAALADARARSGFDRLAVDVARRRVTRTIDGLALDPGGSGKGWALDRAADVLRARGVDVALLSFRSTMLALGHPPGEDGWRIPIAHDEADAIVAEVVLADGALSVSAGGRRGFDDGGVVRGHVIDARTGVPVPAERLAWVRHPTASGADALSTALLVRGTELPAVDGAHGAFVAGAGQTARTWPASR